MKEVTFQIDNNEILVQAPYSDEWRQRAKELGGKWDSVARGWTFDPAFEDEVKDALSEIYGWREGDDRRITVIATAKRDLDGQPAVVCCMRDVARAYGRDSGAYPGDGVAMLSGRIRSGGSRKNWAAIVEAGTRFKITDLPAYVADKYDPDNWDVEIVEGPADDESLAEGEINPLAEYSDDEILAEAKRRGLV